MCSVDFAQLKMLLVLYLKSCSMHTANFSKEELILSLGMIMDKYQESCSQFHPRGNGQNFTELS